MSLLLCSKYYYNLYTFQMPRPIDQSNQGRAHADRGFSLRMGSEALQIPRFCPFLEKYIIS